MFGPDEFMARLRQRLDEVCRKNKTSFRQIALKAGLNPSTVEKYKRGTAGRDGPGIFALLKLRTAIGCDLAYLAGETESLRVADDLTHLDHDALVECIETVVRRHQSEKPEGLARRVAHLYARRMLIAQGSVDLMEVIDDTFHAKDGA